MEENCGAGGPKRQRTMESVGRNKGESLSIMEKRHGIQHFAIFALNLCDLCG